MNCINILPIASIGLDDPSSLLVATTIDLLPRDVDYYYSYLGDLEVRSVISQSLCIDRFLVLIDFDKRIGRSAWHTLRAQHANIIFIALISDKQSAKSKVGRYVLTKPLQPQAILEVIDDVIQGEIECIQSIAV